MTGAEQWRHCEVCQYHEVIRCANNFAFMGCRYGEYRGHPVWGDDWKCPLGDNKPTRKKEPSSWLWDA